MMNVEMSQAEADHLQCLFYHQVSTSAAVRMEVMRTHYLSLGVAVLRSTLDSYSRSLALSHLEDACMRAIQAIALEGTPVIPPHVVIHPTWSMGATP